MQIDWITTSAQLVNFLLLVWLLKRFLYQPVVDAMAARERGIADRLGEAGERERRADAREREFLDKARALDEDYTKRLAAAREAAEQERGRLLGAAREEVAAERAKWLEQLRQEQQDFASGLKGAVGQEAMRIAVRVVADIADASLERQAIDVFLGHLAGLPERERARLTRAESTLRLRTAFDLDETLQAYARSALRERFGTEVGIRFDREPDLLCGVELEGSGYRLSWNVAEHLADVGERLQRKLAAPAGKPGASSAPRAGGSPGSAAAG